MLLPLLFVLVVIFTKVQATPTNVFAQEQYVAVLRA
jgi:hypothetical protein